MKTAPNTSSIPVRRGRFAIPGAQAGTSIVELMIGITLGLALVAGITSLIAQQSGARSELDKSTRQIENGRYGTQLLIDDIQLAGYYGEYTMSETPAPTLPVAMPDPCVIDATSLLAAMPLPIQGYDSPATMPSSMGTCLNNANHLAGTDMLVVRRTDTTSIAAAAAVAPQMYFQYGLMPSSTNYDRILTSGADPSVFTLTQRSPFPLAVLRKYLVHIYFISPCNVPAGGGATCGSSGDDGGNPIPTLKRLELSVSGTGAGASAAFTSVALAEGIENMQFDYGIDTDGDGAPDSYTTAPADTGAWQNVMAIRINLLARNNEKSAGYATDKRYNLGGAGTVGPFVDNYKRHVFSTMARVVNPSARREQ